MGKDTEVEERLLERLREMTAARIRSRPPLPESTYRLQLHAGFTFRDAAAIVPYLHALGVTHCYASPYLKARPGSTHGYDIIDHGSLNPELGSDEDYAALVQALDEHGLGQILDTVPNHMGVATNDNVWWNDVLENGPASRYAAHFDIAWRSSPRPELQDKILLPVLGDSYGDVLESGKLQLEFEGGRFTVAYHDRRFPVAPRSYAQILEHGSEDLGQALGSEDPSMLELQSILTAIHNLPDCSEKRPEKVAEHAREKEIIKRRLAAVASESGPVREFVERNLARFNGSPGDPSSFDLLDELLEHQCYRLSYWRVAPDEINYRRFFDINEMAALSMEREEVFAAAHEVVLRLVADGKVDGLRIDHPDGLYDPAQYFRRLQEAFVLACARLAAESDAELRTLEWDRLRLALGDRLDLGCADEGPSRSPLYVVAEKILGAKEPLVESWAVHGTSGYDFVNMANGLFVDSANEAAFTRLYQQFIADESSFDEVVYRKKLLILNISLASELHMLTYQLDHLAQKSRRSRDFTFNTLRIALRELIACFPVYRSYIADDGPQAADRRYIETAIRRATARNPLLSRSVFRFIRDMLLQETPVSFTAEDRVEQRRFAGKFQQVTAPVTAKGIEDTAFYVYNRFVSLNEVGGDPGRFGVSALAFHNYNGERQRKWPYAMSPLSTHDTKRSEDVRARLNVLSELPDEWRECVGRWSQLNECHRVRIDEQPVPGPNEEYLLYQALVGAWPIERTGSPDDFALEPADYEKFVQRIEAYMEKALHEAKVHTSWINPNEEYDTAISKFIARVLDPSTNGAFLSDFRAFQQRIGRYGFFNSLSQTLLKITCPGVPDTYQGTEIWDFSLVDPDNRRPVNYEHRREMLKQLQEAISSAEADLRELARGLVSSMEDGRVKMYVTSVALRCRRDHPGLFSVGDYLPLTSHGERADHIFAFARRNKEHCAVVAVPRMIARLIPEPGTPPTGENAWSETTLLLGEIARGRYWRNVFTGTTISAAAGEGNRSSLSAAEVFADFPVALLIGDGG